jgi:hypothetical protein
MTHPIHLAATAVYSIISTKLGYLTAKWFTAPLFAIFAAFIHWYVLIAGSYGTPTYWWIFFTLAVSIMGGIIGHVAAAFLVEVGPLLPLPFGFGDTVKNSSIAMVQVAGFVIDFLGFGAYYYFIHWSQENAAISCVLGGCILALVFQFYFTRSITIYQAHTYHEVKFDEKGNRLGGKLDHVTPFQKVSNVNFVLMVLAGLVIVEVLCLYAFNLSIPDEHVWAIVSGQLIAFVAVVLLVLMGYGKALRAQFK